MPMFRKTGMPGGESEASDLPMAYRAKRATSKKASLPAPANISDSDVHYDSIADAIMRQKKSSDPGQADIQQNGEESGQSPYDDMNHEAVMKELYDDSQLEDQPEDSNEKGKDMFSSIKRKRR